MKFLCHIRFVDEKHSYHTFVVKHTSFSVFHVTPIENFVSIVIDKKPAFTLYKEGTTWTLAIDQAEQTLPPQILSTLTNHLDKKIIEINNSKTNLY